MQTIRQMDAHNAAVLTKAIQQRGGECQVRNLRVMCSDDETLCAALEKMPLRIRPAVITPTSVVALK